MAASPVALGPAARTSESRVRRRPRTTLTAAHAAVTILIAAGWLAAGPVSGPYRNHVAELVGLEAIWLMSSSVLMLTRSERLERAVGGVEVELWWHRLAGALGLALGMVHPKLFVPSGDEPSFMAGLVNLLMLAGIVLVAWSFMTPSSRVARWRGPLGWLARRGYDRWLSIHRLLAVFVVAAMVHGVVDSATLLRSPLLLLGYAGVCATGLYALVERFVAARRGGRAVGASVVSARRHGRTVVLRMLPDRPVAHGTAQFVELGVPVSRERPHPVTVVSAPDDPLIEVAVQAVGAGTTRIVDDVAPGDRVRLDAVRGLPDHPATSGRELWLASGIGITPFVARVRARAALAGVPPVDLVWSRRGFADAPYVDELLEAGRHLPWLTLHLRDTARQGRVTVDELLDLVDHRPTELTVVACGSATVVQPLVKGLAARGVPRARITSEAFGFR
ncbi:hypothetical protein ACVMYR_20820 [Micromonospora sp. PTRAS2]